MIELRTKEREQAQSIVVRERVVTALALASNVTPRNRQEDWAREGLQARIARLCASILTIEYYTASEQVGFCRDSCFSSFI